MSEKIKNEITELNQEMNILGKITEFFINRYRMSYLLILMITVVGVSAFMALPRESMPDVSFPFATITTFYNGASPEDVEVLITDEIESAVSELEDVEDITSTSYLGYSIVTVNFTSGVDLDMKKILINNELLEVDFPEGVDSPSIGGFATSNIPILRMSVTGDYDIYTLTQITEDLEDAISKVRGVGNIEIIGGLEREINIVVDPIKLYNYGLSLSSFSQTLATTNVNMPLGNQDLDELHYSIRVDEQLQSVEDIENILLITPNNERLFLRDVARVEDTHEDIEQTASMYIAGDNEIGKSYGAVNLVIEREEGADVVGSSERVLKLINEGKGTLYPEDLTIYVTFNQVDEVANDLEDVTGNAISGLIIVIIVLFLFIGFSESLIVAFVIPMALLSALGVLNYIGASLNGLSILGLIVSLGLLVDNAIVIMENVDRMRHLGLDRKTASIVGTNQVALSVFAATMTTIAAFVPLTLIPGVMGDFVKNIPQAVIITIGASFVISLVITPTLCSRYLPKEKKSKLSERFSIRVISIVGVILLSGYAFRVDNQVGIISVIAALVFGVAMIIKQFFLKSSSLENSKIIIWYAETLKGILTSRSKRFALIGSGVLLLILSMATLPLGILNVEMFPEDDPESFEIRLDAPQGTTLSRMQDITTEVESILIEKTYIESYSVSVGGREKNRASINVELTDKLDREITGYQIMDQLRGNVKTVPGAEIELMFFQPGPSGDSSPISIEFKGEDIDVLKETAYEYLDVLSNVNDVVAPKLNIQEGAPQVQITVNSNKAKALGLSPASIGQELRSYISGVTATTVKWNNTEIDVVVQLESDEITSTEELSRLFITLPNGSKIPMSSVASAVEVDGMGQISHDEFDRVIKVQSSMSVGANSQVILNEFTEKSSHLVLPSSVEMSFGGEAGEIEENFGNLGVSMILAIILVYGILAIQFNSIALPFVVVMTIPMALIGVIFGLLVTGNNFGFYAFMGLVSLVGIAVNDAIVLVDYINYLRGVGYNMVDAIVEAGKTRLIPVFSTTITTCGGILPLAVKSPYYAQLGYSLIFGLMVATVLTLVFIPIFYSLFESKNEKKIQSELNKVDVSL